jgi:hypothetical protein
MQMKIVKISLGVLLGVFLGALVAQTVLIVLGSGQTYSPVADVFRITVVVTCGAYGGGFVQKRVNSESLASNSSIKILKVVGGFFLGCFLASAFNRALFSQIEISRTTQIIGIIAVLCSGITGAVITYKRVNLKKYED